ncbi:hypothetical protein H0H93_013212 [Arthromyces matolae]|nr:hypothetical protein H0H93_013212 [Arthromyces matolae]
MFSQKPLPALPQNSALSLDARQHRTQLIQSFITESNVNVGWVYAIEEALDELGKCLAQGKWLEGLKRLREAKMREAERQKDVQREKESDKSKTTKRKKQQDAESGEASLSSSAEIPGPPESTLTQARTLENTNLTLLGVRHLFLCVAPPTSRPNLPSEDSGFNIVPSIVGCAFTPGTYALQDAILDSLSIETPTILFGNGEGNLGQMVGGTFTFRGVTSPSEHSVLFKILRLAVYTHLSLILEQQLFIDSDIALRFTRPRLPPLFPSVPLVPTISTIQPAADQLGHKAKGLGKKFVSPSSLIPSSLRSLFPFKSSMPRSTTIQPLTRDSSSSSNASSPRNSFDFVRPHLFSIRSPKSPHHGSPNIHPAPASPLHLQPTLPPFTQALSKIQSSAFLLSTSPGVLFDPPALLVELAERENQSAQPQSGVAGAADKLKRIHVKGDERVGLASLVGWGCGSGERKDFEKGMVGSLGFVRQQRIEVLESRYVASNASSTTTEDSPICKCGLLPLGKFLELLIYSSSFGAPTPAICGHTSSTSTTFAPTSTSDGNNGAHTKTPNVNIQRHFASANHTVTFTCHLVEDIFELVVPRLQICAPVSPTPGSTTGNNPTVTPSRCASIDSDTSTVGTCSRTGSLDGEDAKGEGDDEQREKKELRREIKRWWEGVADYLDRLETIIVHVADDDSDFSNFRSKALPRLPSADDQYLYADSNMFDATGLPPLPPLPSPNFASSSLDLESPFPPLPSQPSRLSSLSSLRQSFHRIEQSLYSQLAETRPAGLNDVRRMFWGAARGAEKRLGKWKDKYLRGFEIDMRMENGDDPAKPKDVLEWNGSNEPEWWNLGFHALPGSGAILDENDWGSVIAFTLSSADYQRELTHISTAGRQASSSSTSLTPTPTVQPVPLPIPQPPFLDNVPSLSAQSAHSTSSHASTATTTGPSSIFSAYKLFTTTPSVLSPKMDPDTDSDDLWFVEPEAFSAVVSRISKEHPVPFSIREVLRQQQKSPAPKLDDDSLRLGFGSGIVPKVDGKVKVDPDVGVSRKEADGVVTASANTVGDSAQKLLLKVESRPASEASGASIPSISVNEKKYGDLESEAESETAMRFMLQHRDSSDASRANSPLPHPGRLHHNYLSLDATGIDVDRPHIKYDWTVGKKLKFSCTAYYAKQFEMLRRRCRAVGNQGEAVNGEDMFIQSLRKSKHWKADGGKSKSNFWKTEDERFVIKTLVDAWNVADLQVLIDLAPSYFRYIDSTANKATVLAKMMGFYTIEIRNLETGNIQSKADLLVMENLFYHQTIMKTFDLKGIQGRKVKPSSGSKLDDHEKSKTLFDSEWIEGKHICSCCSQLLTPGWIGQQKALMLVRPHSKHVLRSALRCDAEFLANSNIMDYSLLVGVNQERSYTFAKTLEYKAKHGLKSGKEITVIPPAEYKERFVSALEGYFLACPDKWSKPANAKDVITNTDGLVGVL